MMDIKFYQGDIPENLDLGNQIAVDTETMGLRMRRDRLCLVQLSSGDGVCHLVQIQRGVEPVNLKNMLGDNSRLKLYHYARFDIATLHWFLGVMAQPLFCTKIASKLVRTYTDKHGLADLCRELLEITLDKTMQSSDWGAEKLTDAQLSYAAQDVLYLHQLRDKLTDMLKRENRTQLAEASFAFLPIRAALDQAGYEDIDIFSH